MVEVLDWPCLQALIVTLDDLEAQRADCTPEDAARLDTAIFHAKWHLHMAYIHASDDVRAEYECTPRYWLEER